ncbi:MAG: AAA family ATPase [Brevinematales bacterium]|nr:AAA family ATPase [Brevinematales bacterium]
MANYLKSIEISGFKSFPVKSRIELMDGITGIVGPNGCGKSNVVEAIKWVLGEQSAKNMRGEKMEDVIFNGTKERPPMGMAEVNITLNNDSKWLPIEFSEVSVARRIFRSGEGQYYINKSKVRLKDMVELFLDTGVGRDSYAIFEQGKIDRLLSESPIERRFLFEEFAGISKFKFRKEEAERKLENSRQNLERLNDIVIELEKEVESLRTQAEDANKFNTLQTDLKTLDAKFAALRIKNIQKEIDARIADKNELTRKQKELSEVSREREDSMLATDQDIQTREVDFRAYDEQFALMEQEYAAVRSRLESNRERVRSQTEWLSSMENRIKEEMERLTALAGELKQKEQDSLGINVEKDESASVMNDIQRQIDDVFVKIKSLDESILAKSRSLGFDKIITKDDIERQRQEIVALRTRLENYRVTIEEKWEIGRNFENERAEKNSQLEGFSRDIETLKNELDKIIKEIDLSLQKEKEIRESNRTMGEEIRELQVRLKSMDKTIMDSLERQSAELKKFTERKPMLDARLEAALSRITGAIESGAKVDDILAMVSELRSNFTEYGKYYENILGILYSDEGTYTQKENIQNRIEELTGAIVSNEQKLEETRARLRELQGVRSDIQNAYNKNEFETSSLRKEIQKLDEQISNNHSALKFLETQIASHSDMINKKETLIESMITVVEEYERDIQEFRAARSALGEELNSKKVDFARIDEQYKSVRNEMERIRHQMGDIERHRENFENDKKNTFASLEELKNGIAEDSLTVESLGQKIEAGKIEREKKLKQVEQLKMSRKQIEFQIKELNDQNMKIERQMMELENAIGERNGTLQSIAENAFNTYGIDVRGIPVQEGDNIDTIHADIKRLRADIARLGNVNFLAIEQFQDAKERLEFLLTQRGDVEKAMADIQGLIDETNEKSAEQFSRSFEEIRAAFKKIFGRLFDGGKADLVLVDKENVLTSGIDIFAEPPGKKLQSISLLSGGERALVAIAVIFAILYLKPTPFVILDEIDAPLDDDNIERFKNLLADFRQTSQFILVSHSKSTLEVCDVLYGVTMEELGVSKVINVAFDEAQLLFKDDSDTRANPEL